MPRRDGTGPMGLGAMTGRGMGFCNTRGNRFSNVAGIGAGLGLGLGLGRRFFRNFVPSTKEEEKTYLNNQKTILETQLKNIKESLDSYNDD